MIEDVPEGRNLHRVIPVPWESPADVALEVLLPEERKGEDVLLEVREETPVGFLAPDLEGSADVLEEMDVTELDDDVREDVSGCHSDGLVIVAGEGNKRVIRIFELLEVLHPSLKALGGCKEADWDVMRPVVDAVEERNLLLVTLHCNVLAVHNEGASEAFPIAVPGGDVVVVREPCQLCDDSRVRSIEAPADPRRKRTNARALEVEIQEGFCLFPAVIDAETFPAIVAAMPLQTVARAIPAGAQTATELARRTMALCSLFLEVNMFKKEKGAKTSSKLSFSDT